VKVILASNDNPNYLPFWPLVSQFWRQRIGFTPVLFHITDEETDFYEDEFGLVKKIKALPGPDIPDIHENRAIRYSAFQAQVVRLWGAQLFPDEFCMLADIDSLPLQRQYFVDLCKELEDDALLIPQSDAYEGPLFADCDDAYHLPYTTAKGSIFRDIFDANCDFQTFAERLAGTNKGWHTDEIYLYQCARKYQKCRLGRRGYEDGLPLRCINRDRGWQYSTDRIAADWYIDCYMPRTGGEPCFDMIRLLGFYQIYS